MDASKPQTSRISMDIPDCSCIFANGPITREFADTSYVQNRFARPDCGVPEFLPGPHLRLDIAGQVGEMEILVSADHDALVDPSKETGLTWAKKIGLERIHHSADSRIDAIIIPWIIQLPLAHRLNLVSGKPKDKDIVAADLLHDFNVGAIQCADGQCAIHHKLHIPSSRRFLAGSR